MHIEPGLLNSAKTTSADIGALATLGAHLPLIRRNPALIARTALAAIFFSIFMQIFHIPVGASELHFVGASAVYLLFGFAPTLFGFAIGLVLQGLVFEPTDLINLGVNSLSLILPLIAAHALVGRRFFGKGSPLRVEWASIVRFDAVFYSGVVGMVGFWLLQGNEPTPLAHWTVFAISYLPLIFLEPVFTYFVTRLAKNHAAHPLVNRLSAVPALHLS